MLPLSFLLLLSRNLYYFLSSDIGLISFITSLFRAHSYTCCVEVFRKPRATMTGFSAIIYFNWVRLLPVAGLKRGAIMANRSVGGLKNELFDPGLWPVAYCVLHHLLLFL